MAHAVISLRPRGPGDAKRIGRIVADTTPVKRLTVVDEDVDIRDPLHRDWALNSHYDPVRDTVLIRDVYSALHMDPSVRDYSGNVASGSKVVIDATCTVDPGELSLPSREIMERALAAWHEAELPPFDIPTRLDFRLDSA